MDFSINIVDWVGSSVVDRLVSMIGSYLHDHMPASRKAELKKLQTALTQIGAVMGIAEALKMKHPNAGQAVEQFRQALEASEDVLDELEYRKLEDMVKNQNETSGSESSSNKRKFNVLDNENETLEKLKEAVTMLNRAAAETECLLRLAKMLGIHDLTESQQETGKVSRRETTSFLGGGVLGRKVEKAKIINWLKRPTDHALLSSFGIVGVGGLGKTTLAQYAYQAMHGSDYFDKTIWVCVSTNFNVEDITRKMLGELDESSGSGKPLNALQDILKKKIGSNKILLILDDVWNDERRSDWEQFIAPLRFVQKGSKILFTTRMKSVADLLASVIKTKQQSLALQGFREQELRALFYSYAFRGFNRNNHRDLETFGDQILKMFRGSPLAAKVIGSLLNSNMDHHHWRRILNHGSIFNLELAKDVVDVLKLSYYYLPANLQVCFRFCSIFPQDYLFDKNDLIKMWIASGFIRQQLRPEERPEDIGEDYFNHLLRKSFFEYSKSSKGIGEGYVMHDLMHELAQNVSNGECCRIESTQSPITIPSTIRHVSVHENEIDRVSHLQNLRSLVVFPIINTNSFVLPNNLIKQPLRLLKIKGYCIFKMPKMISCLVHLRYLSFGLNYVSQPNKSSLLDSIYKLYHLQVLEFSTTGDNSSYLGIETTGMTNLLRLRYMGLPVDKIQTIGGIHKLTSLQELIFFIGHEVGYRIDELGKLNNLRHLSIRKIENIRDIAETKSANILRKNNLISLSLRWTLDSNPTNPEQIIDCLQPHPNLMELTVENYKGKRSPTWMGKLPPLKLSSLKLISCPMWKNQLSSWHIPYLKILHIRDCQNLDKLPDMPLSLIEFQISKVGLISLPRLYQSSGNNTLAPLSLKSSLRVVKIESCPKLISLDGFLHQGNLELQAIEELTIEDCERLVHLPTHGFGNLTSMIYLTLTNNPNLVTMEWEGNLLPTKIQRLNMGNCGILDGSLLQASSSLTTLTELQISKYANTSITASHNSLRSLKNLNIWGCTMLIEISFQEEGHGINQENNFNVVKINITDCPNLTILPTLLPLSLTTFLISNVAVSALPHCYQISSSRGGPSASSLTEVEIRKCPNLTELNGFLQQDGIDFQVIMKLYIIDCPNLVHLPVSAFGRFASLTELTIRDCPMLAAFDNQSNLLPTNLKELSIENCGKLDVPLLKSASTLVTLTHLSIINCANISHIPSSENVFGSLSSLSINGCDRLLPDLTMVQAHDANQGSNLAYLKLSHLDIDYLSLLLIEPLKSLKAVNKLIVSNCSPMWALPEEWLLQNSSTLSWLSIWNASTLQSLPDTMARLTALEWLEICKAELLEEEELPELPASLKEKYIEGRRDNFQSGMFTRSYLPFAQSSNH